MFFEPTRVLLAALLASASAGTLVAASPIAEPAHSKRAGGTVQLPGLTLPADADADKQMIVGMFTSAYDVYKSVLHSHLQSIS